MRSVTAGPGLHPLQMLPRYVSYRILIQSGKCVHKISHVCVYICVYVFCFLPKFVMIPLRTLFRQPFTNCHLLTLETLQLHVEHFITTLKLSL
jgi:hypothetical protein